MDQFDVMVNVFGIYIFFIENLINGCIVNESVVVFQDIFVFIVQIVVVDIFNCNSSSIFFDVIGSSIGNIFVYVWIIGIGLLLSGVDGFMLEVGVVGQYILEVIDLQNFCSIISSVIVFIDIFLLNVFLVLFVVLNCDQNSVLFSGDVSNVGIGYDLVWNGLVGGFLFGQDGFELVVV